MPVNSAAVLKQSQPAGSAPCRGHVLRKAKVSPLCALLKAQPFRPQELVGGMEQLGLSSCLVPQPPLKCHL